MNTLILILTSTFLFLSNAYSYTIPADDNVIYKLGNGPSLRALTKDDIKVLAWNIYKGKNEGFREDFFRLHHQFDILVVQEMFLDTLMKDLFNSMYGHYVVTGTSFIYTDENVRTGLTTSSPVKPTSIAFDRTEDREPVINTPKLLLYTTYPIDESEKELLVVNIHAINFVSAKKLLRQLKQAHKRIVLHDGPVIFAGDFNAWNDTKKRYVYNVIKSLNMKEVKFEYDQRTTKFGHPLDYIFYKGLEVKSSYVHGNLESSDHKAMEAHFVYKGM